MINRNQNLRKESNFDVTDKITLAIGRHKEINEAVENFSQYIASQVLAEYIELTDEKDDKARDIEIDDIHTFIKIERINWMPKPANNPAGISYEETSVKFSNVDVFY